VKILNQTVLLQREYILSVGTKSAEYTNLASRSTRFDAERCRRKILQHTPCSNKIVADRLNISEDTVKGHVHNILFKLKANDRTHAVTIALHRGFFEI